MRQPSGRIRSIHIGGIGASSSGGIIRTILGSCISVCLRSPGQEVGGMNHFMLPDGGDDIDSKSSYGKDAMELLLGRCIRLGADPDDFEAKIFGGGHLMYGTDPSTDVASKNIAFAIKALAELRIPIVAQDIGGHQGREILFHTDSGRIQLRRIPSTRMRDENVEFLDWMIQVPVKPIK